MHPILLVAPAVTLVFLFLLRLVGRRHNAAPLPPGPRGLPVIGNMLIADQLTHRGLAKMAKVYGGLLHLRLGTLHAFAVSTPDVAKQVLQTQDKAFSNRPVTTSIRYLTYDCADMAFANYSPLWRQMRKLCVVRLFSRRRTTSWDSVRREVDAIAKTISTEHVGRPVDIGELVFRLTEKITLRAAFGSTLEEEHEVFIGILQEFSRLFGAFNIGDFLPWLSWLDIHGLKGRMRRAREALDLFIDRIIDEHASKPKGDDDDSNSDMVDDMIAFLEDSTSSADAPAVEDLKGRLKLTRDNVKGLIMDVMFGGTETVASAIEWALSELFRSPSDLLAVQRELASVITLDRKVCEADLDKLPFFRSCIKETLRLHPPIPLLLHATASDCVVSGFTVPARSRVMINVWAINRDPSSWKDPDTFKPARFASHSTAAGIDFKGGDFEFLPFGSGRRSCPGMQLGLHALELAVAQLLHCFQWELPDGMEPGELDMRDVFGLTAPRAVRLVAVPRLRRVSCEI